MDKRQQIRKSRELREAERWFARDQAYHKERIGDLSKLDLSGLRVYDKERKAWFSIEQWNSRGSIGTDLTQQKQEVKEELKDQLKQEVKAELKDQLKQEVKQELEDEELMGATGN